MFGLTCQEIMPFTSEYHPIDINVKDNVLLTLGIRATADAAHPEAAGELTYVCESGPQAPKVASIYCR